MEGGLKRKELKCSETGAFFTPPINWRKGAISWGLVIKSKVIYIDLSRPFLKGLKHIFIEQCSGEGNGTPLQYSCLENPMDGGAWEAAVHGVAKSWTWLRDFTFTFHFMPWRRKWQPTPVFLPEESQRWESLVGCLLWGLHRVRYNRSDLAAAAE